MSRAQVDDQGVGMRRTISFSDNADGEDLSHRNVSKAAFLPDARVAKAAFLPDTRVANGDAKLTQEGWHDASAKLLLMFEAQRRAQALKAAPCPRPYDPGPNMPAVVEEEDLGASPALHRMWESQQRVETALEFLVAGQGSLATSVASILAQLRSGTYVPAGETLIEDSHADEKVGAITAVAAHQSQCSSDSKNGRKTSSLSRSSASLATPHSEHKAHALPAHWPACLRVRPELRPPDGPDGTTAGNRMSMLRWRSTPEGESVAEREDALNKWVRDPASPFQSAVLLVGLAVFSHDLTFIPVFFAWDLDCQGYVLGALLASAIFWTVEIVASAVRSKYVGERSQLETPRASALRYARTWLLLDVAVVIADWLTLWLSLSAVPFAKSVRLIRITGVVRALRLQHLVRRMIERLSDTLREVIYLAWLAVLGCWVCHLMACIWYAVARDAASDTSASRIDTDMGFQYLDSLSWAVEHIVALQTSDAPPRDVSEQLFEILSICIGYVCGSLLVSALATQLIEFAALRRERSQNMRLLRRYLSQNSVAPDVTAYVLEQAHMRLSRPKWLDEAGVPVLGSLSGAAICKLRHSICARHLLAHPLLRVLDAVDEGWFRHFCDVAVRVAIVSPGDDVFATNTPAHAAYHIVGGLLTYTQYPRSSPVEEQTSSPVEPGAWVAESALWCDWIHVGTMSAVRLSKVIVLQVAKVLQAVQQHRAISCIVQGYGQAFHQRLVEAAPPLVDWPNDLGVPFTGFPELVYDMPQDIGMAISLQVLDPQFSSQWRSNNFRKLRKEVESGKSAVVLDEQGQPLRVTSLVALQVRRPDNGRLLWQLGVYENGAIKPDLKMPGCQRMKGESVHKALDRLLGGTMEPVAAKLEVTAVKQESTEKASKEFGVHTRYLKTVFYGTHDGDLDAPYFEARGRPWNSGRSSSSSLSMRNSRTPPMPILVGIRPSEKFNRTVFAFGPGSSCRAFAWLLPEEVQELGTKRGQRELEAWLGALSLPVEKEREQEEEEEEREREENSFSGKLQDNGIAQTMGEDEGPAVFWENVVMEQHVNETFA